MPELYRMQAAPPVATNPSIALNHSRSAVTVVDQRQL